MLVSGGVLVKGPSVAWAGTPASWGNWPTSLDLSRMWASYGAIYKQQLWVAVLVNKLARSQARLPLKVYERGAQGRVEARDHPFAELLRQPNRRWSPFATWEWVSSTYNIYGEAFLGKIRDSGGRPVQLVPLHPAGMHAEEERDGRVVWCFQNGRVRIDGIPDEDLFHPRTYNPDSFVRGMSPLEPLRRSLENEDAARRATTAFWRNGARPGVALTHPGVLSQAAADRLKLRWNQIAAGADNTGTTVVLEEGMKPEVLTLSAEEAQYIQSHKMHTEEACAIYDVPPPVVHILEHATYSNITEQMRSMYRDTMAPRLKAFEAELETQIRGSVRPGANGPDFGEEVYAEFLLDEVLRGDFEARATAKAQAISTGQMTPAEGREMENLPFIEGSDQLFINAALVPLGPDGPAPEPQMISPDEARMVMGRLSRPKTLEEVDRAALVAGLNGGTHLVLDALDAAVAGGEGVMALRERIKALAGPTQRDDIVEVLKVIAAKEPVVNIHQAPVTVEASRARRLALKRDVNGSLVGVEEMPDGSR